MPQGILPLFCDDATPINNLISFQKKDGMVYYFHGCLPVFSHGENDERSFRMFTSQLYVDGNCKQSEMVKAFGVTPISVKRAVKKYREGGPGAFFETRRQERKPRVLREEVIERAQEMLNQGRSRQDVAEALNIKIDTFYRALRSGRLVEGAAGKKKRRGRSDEERAERRGQPGGDGDGVHARDRARRRGGGRASRGAQCIRAGP